MLPVYKTSVLVSVLKDTFPPCADVWLLIEANIIQDRACLDLDRYWSKTHFLCRAYLWLFGESIRSHLVVPHIARDDVLLVKTLPEYWQLWRKSFLVSQMNSSFFGTCVSTPLVVSEFPRALLWVPASHSYFTDWVLDCFQNHHVVTS